MHDDFYYIATLHKNVGACIQIYITFLKIGLVLNGTV